MEHGAVCDPQKDIGYGYQAWQVNQAQILAAKSASINVYGK